MEQVRRQNLYTLTQRFGQKRQLGIRMGISPARVTHFLKGPKRFTDKDAAHFCEMLELPVGWLDSPRDSSEIPKRTNELLIFQGTPGSSTRRTRLKKADFEAQALALTERLRGVSCTEVPEQGNAVHERDANAEYLGRLVAAIAKHCNVSPLAIVVPLVNEVWTQTEAAQLMSTSAIQALLRSAE